MGRTEKSILNVWMMNKQPFIQLKKIDSNYYITIGCQEYIIEETYEECDQKCGTIVYCGDYDTLKLCDKCLKNLEKGMIED